ncbi:hypothetical protein LCGC14_1743320 [marine sediment metagenome]|uniref:Uncharacterized protein n=1 Tax=marine sediment metagenome TaxID=412755 RepID=A0A0F9HTN4_9ZZZZ
MVGTRSQTQYNSLKYCTSYFSYITGEINMKKFSKKKVKVIVVCIILVFSIFISMNFNYFQDNSNLEIDDERELKVSGFKEIGPVYIDDKDPANNWLITAATYDWCTGSGTIGNSYVIKDIKITLSGSSENCMTIKNSQKYFLVFNCSFLGSGI